MRLALALLIAFVGELVPEVAGAEGPGKLAQQVYDFHPLTPILADSIEAKWAAKDILDERIVDGMESLTHWKSKASRGMADAPGVELSKEQVFEGENSIRLTTKTRLPITLKTDDRMWDSILLTRAFDREDFSQFNRIAVKVYPECQGHKHPYLLVILHNEGTTPDRGFRNGIHTVMLKNNQWNNVLFEVTHLQRDKVTGVSLVYRQQGNEPDASESVTFYFDRLAWQRVEPDHYEGWDTRDQIAFSHTGYNTGAPKTAVTSVDKGERFQLVSVSDGRVVLDKAARLQQSKIGAFRVLDFSDAREPGTFKLRYGGIETRPFPIQEDVWRSTILKTINHFYCQRCGDAIPGVHDICHQDWHVDADGNRTLLAGGWHDAGDLSQSYTNTSDATAALFRLARRIQADDPSLAHRLTQEGRWGLRWLHKNRFPEGRRVTWTTIDHWSDNALGNEDDKPATTKVSAPDLCWGMLAELEAAETFANDDPDLTATCLDHAKEDWAVIQSLDAERNTELLSLEVWAGSLLYEATQDEAVMRTTVSRADELMACQQKDPMDWALPLNGFFYRDDDSDVLFSYSHHVRVPSPIIGIAELHRLLTEHDKRDQWRKAIELYAGYLKTTAGLASPYMMIPANVYKRGSADETQVLQGLQMDDQYYLRFFPVWKDFRGNTAIMLSDAIGLACANRILDDPEITRICQSQLEWQVGKNPFSQSLMYGEGYDYSPQYSAMSGDIVGGLPVGIQTEGAKDIPYWHPGVLFNYKEIWVHPSARWLALLERMMD